MYPRTWKKVLQILGCLVLCSGLSCARYVPETVPGHRPTGNPGREPSRISKGCSPNDTGSNGVPSEYLEIGLHQFGAASDSSILCSLEKMGSQANTLRIHNKVPCQEKKEEVRRFQILQFILSSGLMDRISVISLDSIDMSDSISSEMQFKEGILRKQNTSISFIELEDVSEEVCRFLFESLEFTKLNMVYVTTNTVGKLYMLDSPNNRDKLPLSLAVGHIVENRSRSKNKR